MGPSSGDPWNGPGIGPSSGDGWSEPGNAPSSGDGRGAVGVGPSSGDAGGVLGIGPSSGDGRGGLGAGPSSGDAGACGADSRALWGGHTGMSSPAPRRSTLRVAVGSSGANGLSGRRGSGSPQGASWGSSGRGALGGPLHDSPPGGSSAADAHGGSPIGSPVAAGQGTEPLDSGVPDHTGIPAAAAVYPAGGCHSDPPGTKPGAWPLPGAFAEEFPKLAGAPPP
ncbi:hypothetical protein [Spongiactinospora sp. TRM90649]|uniref:hypothetical protein n=1 Tax=Spongiactinospora sp. TRM90649 TaxID=3031114 RepID=UPI0023F66F04|nr:hypothetical protein [Spongiactinospora sp. TRM90649]MDF5751498.1 hypothetical protein [Spongiactinospora sp. TRM90649]